MFLRNPDRTVTQQHRDPFEGHPGQQQFHRERIAEPVRVSALHPGKPEQAGEIPHVVARRAVLLRSAGPEIVMFIVAFDGIERGDDEFGQGAINRRAGLRCVEKQFVPRDAITRRQTASPIRRPL